MGIFDGFVGSNVELNPRVALVATLIYVSGGDGHLDDNEIGDILRVVPDRSTLDKALQYCRRNPYPQFLDAAGRMLSPQQKMCAIVNAADLAMGDGFLAPGEQTMLQQMAAAWQIPDQYLSPYVQALMVKNNMTVFN